MGNRVFLALSGGVTFAGLPLTGVNRQDDVLVVAPSRDKFNDFGTQSSVDFFLLRGSEILARLSGKMLIARQGSDQVERSTSAFLRNLLTENVRQAIPLPEALVGHRYVAVLLDEDNYLKLWRLSGLDSGSQILEELHDAGALQSLDDTSGDLTWFRPRSEFGQSLLRGDSTFLAVLNFERVRGKGIRRPADLATRIRVPVSFLDRGEIDFTFPVQALGASRINVLVGENGAGKTRVLRTLAHSQQEILGQDLPPTLFIPSPLDETATYANTSRLDIREHPATERGWIGTTRALATILRASGSREYKILARAVERFLTLENLAMPLVASEEASEVGAFLVQGVSYSTVHSYSSASEGRKTIFFGLIDYSRPPIFVVDGDARRLSSGERSLLGMACLLIQHVPEGGLVLLDEPELSLHPKMIAELMRLVGFLMESRDAHCIVATHSLYVVRECASSQVHVLKPPEDGGRTVRDFVPMIQTLGSGLTELSNVIFDDWEINEYFTQRIRDFVEKGPTTEETKKLNAILGEAGRASLQDAIRDLSKSE